MRHYNLPLAWLVKNSKKCRVINNFVFRVLIFSGFPEILSTPHFKIYDILRTFRPISSPERDEISK